jgi:hypothetical protein
MEPTDQHPMLRAKRPIIITRPSERMAGDSKNSLEIGADALWVDGHGRFGKTQAFRMLSGTELWRPFPLYFAEYTYTKPAKSSEGYFAASFLLQDHQTVSSSAMSNVSLMRVVNQWRSEAARVGAHVICVGINEANRLTEGDLEHVVSIVNELERSTRAFFFLINQIDAKSNVRGALDRRPPPHILGRLFTTSHHFTGLLWDIPSDEAGLQLVSDVALACREYDEVLVWPEGSGVTYTQFFAPHAYARGWRLGTQLDLIRETIDAVRAENGLGPVKDWPMITFERFVYYVLVRIAFDTPDFTELTPGMIRDALHRVAYLHQEPGFKGARA